MKIDLKYLLLVYFSIFLIPQVLSQSPSCVTDRQPKSLERGEQCTDVSTNTYCGDFYGGSFFPGDIAHDADNALAIVDFYLRNNLTCSRYVNLFVCLAVQPICDNATEGRMRVRLPCQDMCWRVKSDCTEEEDMVLDLHCIFNCDLLPEENCLDLQSPLVSSLIPPDNVSSPDTPSLRPVSTSTPTSVLSNSTMESCPSLNRTFFTRESKSFAKGWVAFWSVVCYISTLVTLLTFFLDTSRFQYPWRPVVYIALSFHIHTLGYFLALIAGPGSVTCPGEVYVETDGNWTWLHTPCILVFGLLYYSMIAAFLWWLILTLSWFLSSAYKWTNEAISQFALFYHTAAWVIPLILTIALLAARVVSADELTGTCFIVRTDSNSSFLAMLFGLILPLSLFLLVGSTFLTIGLLSVLQIRKYMVNRGKERESMILEKLMLRIGIYVAIYVLPAAVLIACFVYELDTRPNWHTTSDECTDCLRPNTAVFMVRVFMFLLIGALTGAWIWSRKTLESWKKLPTKLRTWILPPTTDQMATENEKVTSTRLGSFTSPSQYPPHATTRTTPSYPYSMDSGAEFSA